MTDGGEGVAEESGFSALCIFLLCDITVEAEAYFG